AVKQRHLSVAQLSEQRHALPTQERHAGEIEAQASPAREERLTCASQLLDPWPDHATFKCERGRSVRVLTKDDLEHRALLFLTAFGGQGSCRARSSRSGTLSRRKVRRGWKRGRSQPTTGRG